MSGRWLSVSTPHVYCPPPYIPTMVEAENHSTPTQSWRKTEVFKDAYTSSKNIFIVNQSYARIQKSEHQTAFLNQFNITFSLTIIEQYTLGDNIPDNEGYQDAYCTFLLKLNCK